MSNVDLGEMRTYKELGYVKSDNPEHCSECENKTLLMTLDNGRLNIFDYDGENVMVEVLDKVEKFDRQNKTKCITDGYIFYGYFPSINMALKVVYARDVLIDKNTIKTLEEYIGEQTKIVQMIMENKRETLFPKND